MPPRARPSRPCLIEPIEPRLLLSAAAQFASRGPGGGGAFFSPSFSPYNAQELYTVTDMSGLFHSTNLGKSWQMASFKQIQGNRGSSVQFTRDPNTLYTLNYNESAPVRPAKSLDGGATWSDCPGWPALGEDAYSLYADPAATSRILVSDYSHLYISTDGGATFASKYTLPAGLYVAGAFFDGANIYVGTSAGLLVSTNSGASFALSSATGLPAGGAIYSFTGAKQNGVTRLFAALANSADVYPGVLTEDLGASYKGLYSLDVGQPAWQAKTTGIPAAEYPHFISMARNNISTVYAAGPSDAGVPKILKSTDAGAHWTDTLLTTNNQNVATGWQGAGGDRSWGFGELPLGFEVSPTDPNTLAFTDFGYIHLSTDGGATWRQAYTSPADQNPANTLITPHKPYHGVGLEDTSALWLTWADANTLVAGYTDIQGVRSTDAGASWAFPTNISLVGNTLYQVSSLATAAVPSGVILFGAGSSVHDLYQSTYLTDARIDGGTGKIVYSTDKGATWATLHDFGHPVIYTAIDPTNPNRMYASVVHSTQGGIFVTNNLSAGAASTWTKVTSPPRTEGHPFNIKVLNDGTLVVTYSARRTTSFTASSGVFVSTNQGQSWADRTLIGATGAPGMQYWTKDITIDPTDATQNTWYAAVRSGYGGDGSSNDKGGLYRTTNRGVTWTRVFATDSAESAAINPTTGELYVSTLSSGLWFSANPSAASPTFAQVNYPFRQPERIFFNPYDATQVWVTSFGWGLAVSVTPDTTAPIASAGAVDYSTATHKLSIDFSEDVSATLTRSDITVKNTTTNQTLSPSNFAFSYAAQNNRATFTYTPGQLPDGNYTVTLPAGAVLDAAGNPLAADYTFTFFIQTADANHDRTVDFNDLVILAQNYNTTGKSYAQGDFNYDGTVDFNDLVLLAQRYNTTLPAPAFGSTPFSASAALPVPSKSQKATPPVFSLKSISKSTAKPPPTRRNTKMKW